jgi:cell division protease FtsH
MTKENERKQRNQRNPVPPSDPDDGDSPQGSRIGRQLLIWAIVVGGILVGLTMYQRMSDPAEKQVKPGRFFELMESGSIAEMKIEGNTVRATLEGRKGPGSVVRVTFPEGVIEENFEKWSRSTVVDYDPGGGWASYALLNFAPFLLLLLLMLYFFSRQMRAVSSRDGVMPFVGNSTEHAQKEKPQVTFEDVAGVEEAKEEVQEIVEFLRNPEKFQQVGGRIPRGILLVGAPGTGKTLLAKAIAGEADVPFFSLCGSDFVELFVGVGAARVRDLFRNARKNQPAIIFLDEIDAVGRKRGTGLGGGHDEREQTLNAILSEMDGFSRDTGVIVMAATNRPDVLDPALLRPGRFDREIVVDMPDVRGREEILEVHARKVKLASDVKLREIARGTPGFTGADLEALINEAAIRAAMKGQRQVRMADLEEARDKVRFGRQKKRSRVMSEEDRKMTAFHEAGHALAAKLDDNVEPLHKVTIIPRGVSMGMTMVLPEKDKYGVRRKECLGTIKMTLSGRVAESMFCGDISSGAENDIRRATELARKMVTRWGMSDALGPISYSEEEEHVFLGNEITRGKRHSDRMAEKIDQEIESILTESYQAAQQMCEEHADELRSIAEALLELETLSVDEVDSILEGATVADLRERREAEEAERAEERAQDVSEEETDEGPAADGYPRPLGSPA